jgi:prepilin-type N-terminal cleavage/methylation domain-containing protein
MNPRPASADGGFSLIELLVAISITGVVMTGLAYGLTTALDVTADSRDRTIAANLASQEIDLAGAVPADRLTDGTVFHVEDVQGTRFEVTRVSAWEQGVTEAQACTALANSATGRGRRFLQVNVTVGWEGQGLRGPVRSSTAITPAVASYRSGFGHLAITVVDRDAAPVAGVTVTLTGPGVSRVVPTTSIGCAFFSDVPPGTTYRVTVDKPGHVDQDVTTPGYEEPLVVQDGTTTKRQFTYDRGVGLDLTIAGRFGGVIPNGMVVTARSNAATSSDAVSAAGAGTARRTIGATQEDGTPARTLFPHTGGWTVWAGCAHNQPESTAWVEAGGTREVSSTALAPAPGLVGSGTVNAGTLQVRARGLQTARAGQPLYAVDTAAVTGTPCATPLLLGTFGPLGSFSGDVALPIGDWRLVYGVGATPMGGVIRVGPYRAALYTDPYFDMVRADAPSFYYRLGETPATIAVDSSGNTGRNGTYRPEVLRNRLGALPGDPLSNAAGMDGTTDPFITGPGFTFNGAPAFTLEAWIRTTAADRAGRIIGFGSAQTGVSGTRDRHVYMEADGRLTFGVRSGTALQTITTPAQYDDGAWHHVVATFTSSTGGGMRLWVDGTSVVNNTSFTGANSFEGFLRVGYDSLNGWSGLTATPAFTGNIDEAAFYAGALGQTAVQENYAARTGAGYRDVIVGRAPLTYYRLDDDTPAADSSVNGRPGAYRVSVARGAAGALLNDTNAAVTMGATVNALVVNPAAVAGPNVFSLELWFNAPSGSTGGRLLGFGTSLVGTSTRYDRHLYLDANNRLVFGVYPGAYRTVTSPGAYRDGRWHHAVATLGPGGMVLYVDGVSVGTLESTTTAQDSTGYWRIGYDSLSGWPNAPASWAPGGVSIDEVAVYPTVLTPEQVALHYAASGR